MARTDNLNNFLTDVADAIREKKGITDKIKASDFDNEIASIEAGGVTPSGEINITENGTYDVTNYASAVVEVVSSSGGKYTPKAISFRDYTGTDLNYELGNLDTSLLTSAKNMFYGCSNLISIDLSKKDFTNVTDIQGMFYNNSKLQNASIPDLSSGKITSMRAMFRGCSSLTKIDLSKLNTANITSMEEIFYDCSSIVELDLRNFITDKVRYYSNAFRGMTSLRKLDIRRFTFHGAATYTNMFYGVPNDCLIIVLNNTARNNLLERASNLTNIKTYAEYVAEGGA